MGEAYDRQGWRSDVLAACLLALLLAAAWSVRDWHQLAALRLPDTDDAMRLQQIRDWIAGQGFADVSQHRLGAAPGLAMHWSRLPDLVPGALIVALTPLFGQHYAEVAAVITWPALLLAAALFLTARIARAAGGADIARTALVVAAIAYPATTIFLPGRIDHHGLQIVLLLVVVHALVSIPSLTRGLAAGLASAASFAIGLETVPLLAVAGGVMVFEWARARPRSDDRLMGFGIALAAGLLAANIALRTRQWDFPACDGFTAIAWQGAQFAAFAPIVLAIAGHATACRYARSVLALVVTVAAAAGAVHVAPQCLTPYGAVDPLLARVWLSAVGEAQPLFQAAPDVAIGYAGVMIAGIGASLWRLRVTRDAAWGALLALQLAAFALTCLQLRGAYAGAVLAAPALAALIAVARRRGTIALATAWIGSAGMLYPMAAQALALPQQTHRGGPAVQSCTTPAALGRLANVPAGRLMAPIDLGAYAIGATALSVVGAPYHRNTAGNLAVYRFFFGTPEQARGIARDWDVRYVALCPLAGGPGTIEPGTGGIDPMTLLAALQRGAAPRWLRPVGGTNDGLLLYMVEPRLSSPATAR